MPPSSLQLARIHAATKKTILFVTHSIDEALYLADEIVVVSGKPGRISKQLVINARHPRSRASSELAELVAGLREQLLEGSAV